VIKDTVSTIREFSIGDGRTGRFYSLAALGESGGYDISRLPVSIRVVLESVQRNCDGKMITLEHVSQLAAWKPVAQRTEEIPFVVARIVLQDFTGVPLLCDLAAMRGAMAAADMDPSAIEPLVPVDLVVDHSVQIDCSGEPGAHTKNMRIEFTRNRERYQFLKWGMNAFHTFKVIPPGIGIVHQINLEHLAPGVHERAGIFYPDTLVGTDSHTTMINALGVAGWGVGGIEAEAGMLGQPVYFLTPDVVGVNLRGKLEEGITATDLVLTITEVLRKEKVVGAFVEFFGEGAGSLSLPDRATLANMAPEYGATMGFFPVDDVTVEYFKSSGRTEDKTAALRAYMKAQGIYGMPRSGDIDYTRTVDVNLSTVVASVSGPRRPQDRIELNGFSERFENLYSETQERGGFSKTRESLSNRYRVDGDTEIGSGDIMIAAIASCTNTSNPGVLLAAGLLAKKAVDKGLVVKGHVKTSISPGSRVVTAYLKNSGLLPYLEKLGFYVSAYGCASCIGNSGQLDKAIEYTIVENNLVCASVLSGNRNFEARIHPSLKANFLMSPPLVVAYAIAGSVLKDMEMEPLGEGHDGSDVFLRDIWPSNHEISEVMKYATDPEVFMDLYSDFSNEGGLWDEIAFSEDAVYDWPESTYIAQPPFFRDFSMVPADVPEIKGARALGIFGDSLTTDHISPAGPINEDSAAGRYLLGSGVDKADFQSYGTRRGNHEVMIRGTFANVRIKNLMLPPRTDGTRVEGGLTLHQPSGHQLTIYDAAMSYMRGNTHTIVFGGEEYGTGSSRDWAAKGTRLLGVRAVVARSFERIHRSNLVGMGVLPLQFKGDDSVEKLDIRGDEEFQIKGISRLSPQQDVVMTIKRSDGSVADVNLLARVDTPVEVDYFMHGGILPYVLRTLSGRSS